MVTVPRVLRRFITPGRTYPLYGMHHWVHRVIRRLTNVKFYLELTGDSSYVIPYLRVLGYRLPDFEPTGSNFGADQEQLQPDSFLMKGEKVPPHGRWGGNPARAM